MLVQIFNGESFIPHILDDKALRNYYMIQPGFCVIKEMSIINGKVESVVKDLIKSNIRACKMAVNLNKSLGSVYKGLDLQLLRDREAELKLASINCVLYDSKTLIYSYRDEVYVTELYPDQYI